MADYQYFFIKSQNNFIANLNIKPMTCNLGLALLMSFVTATPAVAQSVIPNNDGTGTIVNTDGQTIEIDGGSLSGDGTNLFHSFEEFGLSESEIANFMSNPNIRNILGRINGGDPSIINGLIQVTGGNSNLLLMNPAGIIFGESAQLNVPADFTATTATGIGFEDNVWFNAVGKNNYQTLVGTPHTFAFDEDNSGAIINGGQLKLTQGSNLTFLAGNVINTGEIQAPAGGVTVAAVPGSSRIKISQPGHLLSLEIEPPRDSQGQLLPFTPQDLPQLLTSSGVVGTGLTGNENGSITINETGNSFFPEAEMTINSGEIRVSGDLGGEINIIGNKIGLLSGDLEATGTDGGGNIRVGGAYQGGDSLPQATQTLVDSESKITADAINQGDGGEVVIWSDSLTRFTGEITARGGRQGGDGGLVEVSGKDLLLFTGVVDAESPLGESGELLLDPKNIIISDDDTPLAEIFSPAPENEQADNIGFGVSVATVGEDLLVGSPANVSGGENNAGQAFLFDRNGNTLRTYDNPEPVAGGFFGFAVAAVGDDQLLVGAPRNTFTVDNFSFPEAGQVFLFNKTDSQPLETYNNPNPNAAFISEGVFTGAVPLADTNFGAALAVIDNDRFLIGAPGHTVMTGNGEFPRSGQGFVISREGATLNSFDNPNPTDDGNGQGTGNSFGIAVTALANERGAIGAPRNGDGGQVFVFPLNLAIPEITLDNPQTNGGQFGQSIGRVLGDRLAVGAPDNIDGGVVYIYDLDSGLQPLEILSNPESTGVDFGEALVGVGTEQILVGAGGNRDGAGQAFLFETGNPDPVKTYDNPQTVGGGSFGTAVSSFNDQGVLIGAAENDVLGLTNAGAAFVSLATTVLDADSFTEVIEFDTDPDSTFFISPEIIVNVLNTGTDVILQASNDIDLRSGQDIISDHPDGDGGNITLQAGRNLTINSDIITDQGNIILEANAPVAEEVVAEFRDSGIGTIEITEGVTLDAGSGDLTVNIAEGEGTRGDISLANLVGDQITLTAGIGTVEVTGSIEATGDITVTGDEINFLGGDNSVTGENITLRATEGQDINLGNQSDLNALDLTATDIRALDITNLITISSPSSTATVRLFESVADGGTTPFQNPVTIIGGETLIAPDLDFTWELEGENLDPIFANGLDYRNFEHYQGGEGDNTFVLSSIAIASIDGGGGNNTLISSDDNTVFNLTDLDAGNIDELTEFTSIQNLIGGNGDDIFSFVGDTPELTGNLDGGNGNNQLDYQLFTAFDPETFIFAPERGEATRINGTVTGINNGVNLPSTASTETIPANLEIQVRNDLEATGGIASAIPVTEINNLARGQDTTGIGELALLNRLDSNFTQDYENYFSRDLDGNQQSASAELGVDLAKVQETLRTIEESTGAKPALIYASFFPAGINALQGRNSNVLPQPNDQLELVIITAQGKAIRREIKGVTRADVRRSARRLTNGVAGLQPERLFLPHAQQLYQWLIEPLKGELSAQEISNLVFLMDTGLRSLPIAALHDGEKYLIQEYSVGLMPSINLTDTRYQNINSVDLLAMGSETFPADSTLVELPAVPVEIDIITEKLWSGGSSFMDADFTINNLKQTQKSRPFGILHLATHAEFNPGTPQNSYIQFGDRKLELGQIRELGLNNPQVELMVLSACKTAVGDRDAEFGFAGLAHQAGVKSALGSLWYISDEGTLALMSKFYQELKQAPIKAEALRLAQVGMIEGEVRLEKGQLITAKQIFELPSNIQMIDLTHPFFWSPYTIIGNPW